MGRCWYCDDTSHITHDCSKFKELTFKELSKFVRTNRIRYKCFSRKHKTNDCKRNNLCKVKGCKGTFHYFLLHNYDSSRGISQASPNNKPSGNTIPIKDGESDSGTGVTQAVTCSQASDGVYPCVVPVKVMHGNKTVIAYTFLDQGLTHSFCDKRLVNAFVIDDDLQSITLHTLGNAATIHFGHKLNLKVFSLDDSYVVDLPKVFSIDNTPVRPNLIPAKCEIKGMQHLCDLAFTKVDGALVTLLIEADVPELFCPAAFRKDRRGEAVAIKTPLGWYLLGPSLSLSSTQNCTVNLVKHHDITVEQQIQTIWSADFEKGTIVLDVLFSREDHLMYKLLQDSLKMIYGRFQLALPWRSGVASLPNNRSVALNRLLCPKRRFTKTRLSRKDMSTLLTNICQKDMHPKYIFPQTNATMSLCGTFPTTQSYILTNHLRCV